LTRFLIASLVNWHQEFQLMSGLRLMKASLSGKLKKKLKL
jgi:hypothetical protein